jgi:hypothetical protein
MNTSYEVLAMIEGNHNLKLESKFTIFRIL